MALLARNCIASLGIAGPLHTMSLVYEKLPMLSRESQYVDIA